MFRPWLRSTAEIAANQKATVVIQHDAGGLGKLPAFAVSRK